MSSLEKHYVQWCKNLFGRDEREHLEEVLHGDLDGYWEEIKNMKEYPEFIKWRDLSNMMLRKCKLNEWDLPQEEKEIHTPQEERKQHVQKLIRKIVEKNGKS